jgi:hypothetical protein
VVIWKGPGKAYSYAQAKWGVPDRLGIKDAEGTVHWTAASNVEVLDPEEYLPDYDWLVTMAEARGREDAGVDWRVAA